MYILCDKLINGYRDILSRGNNPYNPKPDQLQEEIEYSQWPETDNDNDVRRNETTGNYELKNDSLILDEYKRQTLLKAQEMAYLIVNNYRYKIEQYYDRLQLGQTLTTEEQTDFTDLLTTITDGKIWIKSKAQNIEDITIVTTLEDAKNDVDAIYEQIKTKYVNKLNDMEIVINGI